MSSKTVDLVRAAYDAINQGDMDPYFALFHTEGEFVEPASLPYGGTHRGHGGLVQLVVAIDALWEGTRYEIEELLDAGDVVVVVGRVWSQSRKTGEEIDEPLIEILRFKDDKIVSARAFADTARFLAALGLAAGTPA